MNVNSATLRNIDTRHSYYLDNNGQIARGGFGHWFKCFFNIGDARQRVAALAEKVKAALLKDGAIEQEATLDSEINNLDGKYLKVTYAISGVQLKAIADRFCSDHTAAIGRSDARRLAEACAESAVNATLAKKSSSIVNNADNAKFLKRICVYAVSHHIEGRAPYVNLPPTGPDSLEASMNNTIKSVLSNYPSVSAASGHMKKGLPLITSDGSKGYAGANIKFDEFYFRIYVAMMVNVNEAGTDCSLSPSLNTMGNLLWMDNSVISRARNEILALKMPPAGEPGGLARFAADVRRIVGSYELCNEAARDWLNPLNTSVDERFPPLTVTRLTDKVLDKMYDLYGDKVVDSFREKSRLKFRLMLAGRPDYLNALNKSVDDANQAHKKLSEDNVALENLEKAVDDVCRYNCALKSLADKISQITYRFGASENMARAKAFAEAHAEIFEKLWHAASSDDVNAALNEAADAIKVDDLKNSALKDAKARFAKEGGIPADVLKSIEKALDEAARKIIEGEEKLPEDETAAKNAIKARFKGLVDEFVAAGANPVAGANA